MKKIFLLLSFCLLSTKTISLTKISPYIGTDVNGYAVIIYENPEAGTINTSIFNGSNWSASSPISTSGLSSYAPKFIFDPLTGNAAAVWMSIDPQTNANLLYGSTFNGSSQTWTTAIKITNNTVNVISQYVELSLAPNSITGITPNTVRAVWTEFNSTGGKEVATVSTPGTISDGWVSGFTVIA